MLTRIPKTSVPSVEATVISLPTAAIKRNNAEAIWLVSARTMNCLNNLLSRHMKHVVIYS